MNRLFATFFFVVLVCATAIQAQTIRLTRVDAQPEKSHFITATLPFSIEISLEGINNVTAVSFELRYGNAGSIQLSGYSGGSFGSNGLVVIDKSNQTSGAGSISVGVLSGQPAGGGGVNDPIVVRLDFITTPNAIHNTNTMFSFINAEAVADGSIVRLAGIPVVYNVHGFIDVWPGDADNNGIVDTRDISIIGLFFDDGGSDGRIRGFSRKPASTAWAPQTALSWDSVRVTYADADGSGKVDINDLLVVYANFSKTHLKFKSDGDVMSPRSGEEETVLSPTAQLIPVLLESPQPVLGVATTLSWKKLAGKFNVIGFQRGEAFGAGEGFFTKINSDNQTAQFAVGNFHPGQEVLLHGGNAVIYLVIEPLGDDTEFSFDLENPVGIRRSGAIVSLGSTTTSVDTPTNNTGFDVYPNPASGQVFASFEAVRSGVVTISLVDATGRVVYRTEEHVEAGSVQLPVDASAVTAGVYLLVVETEQGKSVRTISIIH